MIASKVKSMFQMAAKSSFAWSLSSKTSSNFSYKIFGIVRHSVTQCSVKPVSKSLVKSYISPCNHTYCQEIVHIVG